jgi:putative ABC transport system permease protein
MLIAGSRATERRPASLRAAIATAAQLAIALMLLAGALAMIGDVKRRAERERGYDPRNLLTASIALSPQRYPDAEERERFYDALDEALQAIPGVESAGTVNLFPAAGQGALLARIEGEGVESRSDAPLLAQNRLVHGRLLETLRLRLVRGRSLTADELHRGDSVAVVSETLATTLWPGEDPIGRRLRDRRREGAPWLRIVGVVHDLEESYADTARAIWQPVKVSTAAASTAQATIVLRSAVAPQALAESLRATVRRIDPQLAVSEIMTAQEMLRHALAGRESARTLTAAFAMLGLTLAAIGVYASMAFAMMRRTRELAVRVALGATSHTLTRQFLGGAGVVIVAGSAAGIAGAISIARMGRSVAGDFTITPGPLLAATAVIATVALLASWLPLRRALHLEPNAVLRSE